MFKTWLGKKNEQEKLQREEWERLRILGSWVLAPYSNRVTPKSLLPLPWDVQETTEQWKERNADILKRADELWDSFENKK